MQAGGFQAAGAAATARTGTGNSSSGPHSGSDSRGACGDAGGAASRRGAGCDGGGDATAATTLRVLTWNVNGLRAVLKRGAQPLRDVGAMLASLGADVVCLQETKLARSEMQRELAVVDGWDAYFSFCRTRTGYSGVATYCRTAATTPVAAEAGFTGLNPFPAAASAGGGGGNSGVGNGYGAGNSGSAAAAAAAGAGSSDGGGGGGALPGAEVLRERFSREELEELDSEGRVVLTDHGAFVLCNVYGPAVTGEETAGERFAYKMRFYEALRMRLDALLAAGRAVVLLGDLNINPQPIDSAGATESGAKAARARASGELGAWPLRRDRAWLHGMLRGGGGPWVDAFRELWPARTGAYTCWSTASSARLLNHGTRIDLILLAGPAPADASASANADADAETAAGDDAAAAPSRMLPRALAPPVPVLTRAAAAAAAQLGERGGLDPAYFLTPAEASDAAERVEAALLRAVPAVAAGTPAAAAARAGVHAGHPPQQQGQGQGQGQGRGRGQQQWPVVPAPSSRHGFFAHCCAWCDVQPEVPSSDHAPCYADLLLPRASLPMGLEPALASARRLYPGTQATLRSFWGAAAATDAAAAAAAGTAAGAATNGGGSGGAAAAAGFGSGGGSMRGAGVQPQAAQERMASSGGDGVGGGDGAASGGGQQWLGRSGSQGSGRAGAGAGGAGGRDPGAGAGGAGARQASLTSFFAPRQQQQQQRPQQQNPGGGGGSNGGSSGPLQQQNPPQQQQQQGQQGSEASSAVAAAVEREYAAQQAAVSAKNAAAAAAWRQLQQRMAPPKCRGHREPCVLRTVTKKCENKGRSFWVCARPAGPFPGPGRCDHFEWTSSFKGSGPGSGGGGGGSKSAGAAGGGIKKR